MEFQQFINFLKKRESYDFYMKILKDCPVHKDINTINELERLFNEEQSYPYVQMVIVSRVISFYHVQLLKGYDSYLRFNQLYHDWCDYYNTLTYGKWNYSNS